MNRQPGKLPQAVDDCHELLAWIIPQIEKFPRSRRFTLGERLESGLLDVLEALLEATYHRSRGPSLERANRRLDIVRHLWRLSHTLRATATRQYAHGAKLMDGVGRQIGGWQKHATG